MDFISYPRKLALALIKIIARYFAAHEVSLLKGKAPREKSLGAFLVYMLLNSLSGFFPVLAFKFPFGLFSRFKFPFAQNSRFALYLNSLSGFFPVLS